MDKREVGLLWTNGGIGLPRHFALRLGEGTGEITVKMTEAEAKDLFGQMEAYRDDWRMPAELTPLEKEMGAALQAAWDRLGTKGSDRPAKVDKRIMDALEAFKKALVGTPDEFPTKPTAVELSKTEARDLFELISSAFAIEGGKVLKPNVRKNLEEAEFKLQAYVWPGLCGPWGCYGEHSTSDCNNAICDKCKIRYDQCTCSTGPTIRVR